MYFRKQKLADAEMGYFITHLPLHGLDRIIAGPEAPGPALIFSPPAFEPKMAAAGPGGCMGFAPVPGRDDAFLMITGFFPIFQSEGAGIHLFQAVNGMDEPWQGRRIIDLPFVHRIAEIDNGAEHFLVAATVCGGKDFQDDWSKPGQTYVARFPDDPEGSWELQPVMGPIHQNHGMTVCDFGGRRGVMIAGSEGLFFLEPPEPGSKDWSHTQILEHGISEVCIADLDGDGVEELAVIEPFHGDGVSVYKDRGGVWTRIWSAQVAFGHGLWAGSLGGESVVIAGDRQGDKNLLCFKVTSAEPFEMEAIVIDHGSGTTNMDVVETPDGRALVSSNPGHGEYAMYVVEGG